MEKYLQSSKKTIIARGGGGGGAYTGKQIFTAGFSWIEPLPVNKTKEFCKSAIIYIIITILFIMIIAGLIMLGLKVLS